MLASTVMFSQCYISLAVFLNVIKTDFQRTLLVRTDILIKNEIISILIENRKIIFHAVESCFFTL